MKSYILNIPGRPVPKSRPRVTKTGHAYTPQKTKDGELIVRSLWVGKYGAPMLEGPICITVMFYIEVPKSWNKTKRDAALNGEIYPTGRPDIDNLVKLVQDALNGIAYKDDSQIVSLSAYKKYTEEPKTVVIVYEQDGDRVEG